MAYTVPTLDELTERAIQRHRADLPGTDAYLWPNTEHVFIKAVAGIVFTAVEYLSWVKKQRFATEADDSELDAHGKPWRLPRKPAVAAHGAVVVKGVIGYTVPLDTLFQRSDGVRFKVTAATVIDADGIVSVPVQAVETGSAGNTDVSTDLTVLEANSNIAAVKVDAYGVGAGAGVESEEEYRDRILQRQGSEPMGGSVPDYVRWVTSVPGVTRVWVEKRSFGHGTVGIWVMSDGALNTGIPSPVLLADIAAYLEGLAPATAHPILRAPKEAGIDVKVLGVTPNAAEQEQIEKEVRDIFRRRVSPSLKFKRFTLDPNLFWQAVARVTGSTTHRVVFPVETVMPAEFIPVFRSICYS